MSFAQAQDLLIERMRDAGIPAVSHASQLHALPAVLLAPSEFSYDRLRRDSYTASFEAYIIARDSGVTNQPLDDLYSIASKLAHDYGVQDFEAVSVTLTNFGGGDGLPALRTEIHIDVKETPDEN